MITKILFILFCLIAFFVSLGLIISGLAKKRMSIWGGGLGLLLFSVLTPAYVIMKTLSDGVESTMAYVSSDQMQEDVRNTSKTMGKTTGSIISGQVEGMAETLDENAFLALAKKSARIVGKGIVGVTTELNGTLGSTLVYTSEQADAFGIEIGRAQQAGKGDAKAVGLFVEFKRSFQGVLKLESFDGQGRKMDVAVLEINEREGASRHLDFFFQKNGPGLSGYCILMAYPADN